MCLKSEIFINIHTIKPLDKDIIIAAAKETGAIVTAEEHNIIGGLGSAVAEILAEMKNRRARLLRIGLHDQYAETVGSQSYLRDRYGLSAAKIASGIEAAICE